MLIVKSEKLTEMEKIEFGNFRKIKIAYRSHPVYGTPTKIESVHTHLIDLVTKFFN